MRILWLTLFVVIGAQCAWAGKGAPPDLIGTFATDSGACRSWNRRTEGLTIISEDSIAECGGTACEAKINSYEKLKAGGYLLHLTSPGNPEGWEKPIRVIDESIIGMGTDLMLRCTKAHIRDGVGLPAPGSGTDAAWAFSSSYAVVGSDICSSFVPDMTKAMLLIASSEVALAKHEKNSGRSPLFGKTFEQAAHSRILELISDAASAARMDKADLPDFCDALSSAFGSTGTVIPGLLKTSSGKKDEN
jgi:hypothetical protein